MAGFVCEARGEDQTERALPGGGFGASRTGTANGGHIRTDRGKLHFDRSIEPGGYAWWYVDAISDDGTKALTLIAFIGSVFSPYYAWASRKTPAPAQNHCAMNVALYERRGGYWAMTERGSGSLERSADTLRIGPSALHWDGAALTAEIDELCAPVPRRLRGRIKVSPLAIQKQVFDLDPGKKHRWKTHRTAGQGRFTFSGPRGFVVG